MNQIQVIEVKGQRVLTTAQLAESYGADKQLIVNNFNRNKARYAEGKHFIALEGSEKNDFIDQHQIDLGSKNAKVLYLWSEKGALLHAKSLNTDAAWEAYGMLVDEYYRLVESQQPQPLSARQQLLLIMQANEETAKRVDSIEKTVTTLVETMRIDSTEQFQVNDAGKKKVLAALGGKESPAYEQLSRVVFAELWRDFKKYFVIPRYSDLPKSKFVAGMEFIELWEPSAVTRMEIRNINGQGTLV